MIEWGHKGMFILSCSARGFHLNLVSLPSYWNLTATQAVMKDLELLRNIKGWTKYPHFL